MVGEKKDMRGFELPPLPPPPPRRAPTPLEEAGIPIPPTPPAPRRMGLHDIDEMGLPRSHPPHKAPAPPAPRVLPPGKSPPLFIKIDKYTEIVISLQKLKSYALGLRDAIDALSDIQKELTNGLQIAQKALNNFNAIITNLDSKLMRMQVIGKLEGEDAEKAPDESTYIKDLYKQIDRIKDELEALS